MIEELEKDWFWIHECLPPFRMKVICLLQDGKEVVLYRQKNNKWSDPKVKRDEVTHWKLIPPPPPPGKFTDTTKLTFGLHRGKELANVPASYLLWCYDNYVGGDLLREYIRDNKEILEQELSSKKFKK